MVHEFLVYFHGKSLLLKQIHTKCPNRCICETYDWQKYCSEEAKLVCNTMSSSCRATGVIAIRHPTLGNVSRVFPSGATLNIGYDWVGSLSPYPLNFKLCNFACNCAQPGETVFKYTLSILNVVEIEEELPFEESQEISCPGFSMDIQSHRQADILTNIEKRRLAKREELTLNSSPDKQKKITVKRQNALENMFSLYETLNTEERSHITFEKESAYGDGVTREVYSQFFKEFFALKRVQGLSRTCLVR